ncbi:hypothetical protein EBR43_12790, partial [bacterium]|nr:hypothetical protein [bacterium]
FKKLVGDFFQGFLTSLGVSQKAINALKFIVNHLKEIFLAYFGIKVFKQVMSAFDAVKKLAQVTGILAEATQASNDANSTDLDLERKKTRSLKEKQEVLKRRLNKKGIKYTAKTKLISTLRKNVRAVKNKFNKVKAFATSTFTKLKEMVKVKNLFMSFKRMVFGGLRNILKAVRVIKTGLAVTGVGFLVGVAVDAAISTALDYFTTDPEKGESTLRQLGKLFADNVIKSVTFGLADLNSLKRLFNKLIDLLPVPDWVKKKIKFDVAEEKTDKEEKSKTAPVPAAQPAATGKPPVSSAPPKGGAETATAQSTSSTKQEKQPKATATPPSEKQEAKTEKKPAATGSTDKTAPQSAAEQKPKTSSTGGSQNTTASSSGQPSDNKSNKSAASGSESTSTPVAKPAPGNTSQKSTAQEPEDKKFKLPPGWALDPTTGFICLPGAYKLMGVIRLDPDKTSQSEIDKINDEFLYKEKHQYDELNNNPGPWGKSKKVNDMSAENTTNKKEMQKDTQGVVIVNNNTKNI